MREIKFRVWSGEDMIYQGLSNGQMTVGDLFNKYPSTLMQFTGLKDKKGKEIYEGDIIFIERKHKDYKVRCEEANNQVIWVEDFATFGTTLDRVFDWLSYANKYKVVGNIYENPELVSNSNSN